MVGEIFDQSACLTCPLCFCIAAEQSIVQHTQKNITNYFVFLLYGREKILQLEKDDGQGLKYLLAEVFYDNAFVFLVFLRFTLTPLLSDQVVK